MFLDDHRLPALVRTRPRRPSGLRLLSLALLFAFLFGGGVALGVIADDSNEAGDSSSLNDVNGKQGQANNGDGTNGASEDESFTLEVVVIGDGRGTVQGGEIVCPPVPCEEQLAKGSKVKLEADADEKSVFEGFSSADCTGTDPCDLTMTEAVRAWASWHPPGVHPARPSRRAWLVSPGAEVAFCRGGAVVPRLASGRRSRLRRVRRSGPQRSLWRSAISARKPRSSRMQRRLSIRDSSPRES